MSILFGVFHRDGRPVDPMLLAHMHAAVAQCPHEGYRHAATGPAAFGQLLTYHTPEAVHESGPRYLAHSGLLFDAAGRLDNRAEVAAALGVPARPDVPDGALMLQAYLRWGDDAPNHLTGDWLFAAFHEHDRSLLLARDHYGNTDLTYHLHDDLVVFSSNRLALLALDAVPKQPNKEAVLRTLLLWRGADERLTYHQDVYRVPGGHTLSVSPTRTSLRQYWFPERTGPLLLPQRRDYAEALHGLLTDAVRARLRTHRPAASTLSGGRDSGAVSYLAAELLAADGQRLTTMSHVPRYAPSRLLDGRRMGDERPAIEETVAASGHIDPLFLDGHAVSLIGGMERFLDIARFPIHAACNAYWLVDLVQTARDRGFGTLLTGDAGNGTISLPGTLGERSWSDVYAAAGMPGLVQYKLLRPLRRWGRKMRGRRTTGSALAWPGAYLNQAGAWPSELLAQLRAERFTPGHPPPIVTTRDRALAILNIGYHMRGYIASHLSDAFGISLRDPTADRRVIEFVLRVPEAVFFDERGQPSPLVVPMLRGRLPDAVLFPSLKGLQSADVGLRAHHQRDEVDAAIAPLKHSATAAALLDVGTLAHTWQKQRAIDDNRYDTNALHLMLRALMFGLFLARFDGESRSRLG